MRDPGNPGAFAGTTRQVNANSIVKGLYMGLCNVMWWG